MDFGKTFIGDCHITKPKAISAVSKGSELGKKLLQITMTGYDHIYSFLLHDENKYPLVKMIGEPRPVSESVDFQAISPVAFTIYNHLSVMVYIYKLDTDHHNVTYFGDIPADSKPVSTTPDFTGQWWVAHASKDRDSTILGYYVAYPGCTTWDIASFPTDSFLPSAWNSAQPWNVRITNNLKTYVCIWQVMPNGSLNFVAACNSCFSTYCGPCYIGTFLVTI